VLRIWNNDLTENEEGVLTAILNELDSNAQAH
jgi:very-short-patch-repair endonuclease